MQCKKTLELLMNSNMKKSWMQRCVVSALQMFYRIAILRNSLEVEFFY